MQSKSKVLKGKRVDGQNNIGNTRVKKTEQ